MATTEQNALIRAKDAQGNSSIIYPITKAENVDGLDEIFVQSDWNQNDETSPDYVKNRTHYISTSEETVSECTANCSWAEMNWAEYSLSESVELVPGERYRLYINDDVLYADGRYDEAEGLWLNTLDESDKVFWFDGSTINGYHSMIEDGDSFPVKIVHVTEEVHQLDEKYIPDSIARTDALETVAAGKADSVHNHDDRYYTETEIDSKVATLNTSISGKAASSHTHDDRYYTESEIDSKVSTLNTSISGKADVTHAHTISDVTDLQTTLDGKMSATDPVATGSFSMGREAGTTVGTNSHTEGSKNTASGYASHAEGSSTKASGDYSHAEGFKAKAIGNYSHAEGYWTEAIGNYSHVQGRYNIEDTVNKYAHIVGNGSEQDNIITSSNAHTLDWDGNAWYAGTLKLGGTSYDDASEVALKSDVVSKTDLDSHTADTTIHITSSERTNWNAAKTHADSAHAPSNAEKNQNAFSNIMVGSTTIAADSITDTLTLAGSNVTITPDATNDKVTIGITKDNVTAALGYTPPTTNTTYSAATTSAAGLMSASDKSKLDGIASGANAYTLPAAGSTLGGVKSGGDVTISSGVITVNDDSHNHVITNVDGLQSTLDAKASLSQLYNTTITTSGNGSAYTATVSGITALTAGISFVMIPHVVSTSTQPTLNVNGLGAKYIRRRLSTLTGTLVAGSSTNWITANKPIRMIYDGTYWVVDLVRPSASDIYGSVPITSGGTGGTSAETARANLGAMADVAVTSADAGKFLRVSSAGVWAAESLIIAEEVSF